MNGYSRLFRSRWSALLWAAGICWSAYWFASPSGDEPANNQTVLTDAAGAPYNEADVAAFESALNQMRNN